MCGLQAHPPSIREELEISRVLGKMTLFIQVIFTAPLHYHHIQADKINALSQYASYQKYQAPVGLSPQAREELQWWLGGMEWQGSSGTSTRIGDKETNALTHRWGAYCNTV